MTPHERFPAWRRCQPVDRPPLLESDLWEGTVRRWRSESGLSREGVLAWQDECDAHDDTGVDFAMIPPCPSATPPTGTIDRELATRLPLALEGGYIPTVDHAVPPDVSWDSWRCYWEPKKHLLGVG